VLIREYKMPISTKEQPTHLIYKDFIDKEFYMMNFSSEKGCKRILF